MLQSPCTDPKQKLIYRLPVRRVQFYPARQSSVGGISWAALARQGKARQVLMVCIWAQVGVRSTATVSDTYTRQSMHGKHDDATTFDFCLLQHWPLLAPRAFKRQIIINAPRWKRPEHKTYFWNGFFWTSSPGPFKCFSRQPRKMRISRPISKLFIRKMLYRYMT